MREVDFWDATMRTLQNRMEGHFEAIELQEQQAWERARFIASTMSKEAGKVKFPWEKKRARKRGRRLSAEEQRKRFADIDKFLQMNAEKQTDGE